MYEKFRSMRLAYFSELNTYLWVSFLEKGASLIRRVMGVYVWDFSLKDMGHLVCCHHQASRLLIYFFIEKNTIIHINENKKRCDITVIVEAMYELLC